MEKINIVKGVASLLTGAGVGKTVDLAIQNNLPSNMKWTTRVLTFIGSSVISSFISYKMSDYVEDQIDNVKDLYDNLTKNLKEGSVEIVEEDKE